MLTIFVLIETGGWASLPPRISFSLNALLTVITPPQRSASATKPAATVAAIEPPARAEPGVGCFVLVTRDLNSNWTGARIRDSNADETWEPEGTPRAEDDPALPPRAEDGFVVWCLLIDDNLQRRTDSSDDVRPSIAVTGRTRVTLPSSNARIARCGAPPCSRLLLIRTKP